MINFTINKKVKQVFTLYSSMIISLFVGIGVSVFNTRVLGPQAYGDFKFILNLYSFVFSFLTFGLFFSGSRLIAKKENESIKHKLMSNILLLTLFLSILFMLIMYILSFFEETIYNNNLGLIIRLFVPLIFVIPFQLSLENILQGDNRIYTLSIFRLGPKMLYLMLVIILNFYIPVNIQLALFIHLAVMALFTILIIFRIKPELRLNKMILSRIWTENTNYGIHVYIGAITGVASSYLAGLSLGYFVDNINVGFFALALTATKPLTMIRL